MNFKKKEAGGHINMKAVSGYLGLQQSSQISHCLCMLVYSYLFIREVGESLGL